MVQNAIDAEIAACDALSLQATQAGAQSFARLLKLTETRDSGQIPRIARFLAATFNGQAFQFDLFELRAVDIAISNDMLCCLDALRWAVPTCTRSSLTVTPACAQSSSGGACTGRRASDRGATDSRGRAAPRRGVRARLTAACAASRLLPASGSGRVTRIECIAIATHCLPTMKTATLPSLRVEPELREAAESVLQEGETLSGFIEASVRETIQRRRVRSEFIARGLASREEAKRTGAYIDAEVVHAELAKKLAQARTKLQKKARA